LTKLSLQSDSVVYLPDHEVNGFSFFKLSCRETDFTLIICIFTFTLRNLRDNRSDLGNYTHNGYIDDASDRH